MKGQLLFFKSELRDLKHSAIQAPKVTMNALQLLCCSLQTEQVSYYTLTKLPNLHGAGVQQEKGTGPFHKDLESSE